MLAVKILMEIVDVVKILIKLKIKVENIHEFENLENNQNLNLCLFFKKKYYYFNF